tara:strand:+ start:252 stop:1088 length:837 start_codon:yes stop_codon:yes gene_type:complete
MALMTLQDLEEHYNKAKFSNTSPVSLENMSIYGDTYGDTVAPMAVNTNVAPQNVNVPSGINNIDLTSSPINRIEPYLPIIPQGEGQGNDNSIFNNYYKYRDINDPSDPFFKTRENQTGLAGILQFLKKISPVANVMKLGKTGIETAQKYFANKKENQRIADEINERERKRQIDKIQKKIYESPYSDPYHGGKGGSQIFSSTEKEKAVQPITAAKEKAAAVQQDLADSYRGHQGGNGGGAIGTSSSQPGGNVGGLGGHGPARWKEGGRIRYGEGGIVTL